MTSYTEGETLIVLAVFAATYLGMALGRVPGLKIDRTGIAMLAVACLLAAGPLDLHAVGRAVDVPTLVLLFALMIVSAQFAGSGFYDLCARRITLARAGPSVLLALTVAIGGGLSAILANDIVVFSLTPLLCRGLADRGLDPRPFLIALAGASNAGSAATVIGNPQNILIGQVGGLDFWEFVGVCGVPAVVALVLVYAVVRWVWRAELKVRPAAPISPVSVAVDRWLIAKGCVAVFVLVALFATPVPREIGALALAAILLASRRMASRDMIAAVDTHLLLLIACLFAVTAAFAGTGIAQAAMAALEAANLLPDSVLILGPLALFLSNTIGNVPAVILVTSVWSDVPEGTYYGLALLSTLAGNLLLIGSLANLIVAERAASAGFRLGFLDFARAGVPMTLASMAFAGGWLVLGGWMPLN